MGHATFYTHQTNGMCWRVRVQLHASNRKPCYVGPNNYNNFYLSHIFYVGHCLMQVIFMWVHLLTEVVFSQGSFCYGS